MTTVTIAQENDVELALDSALLFYRSQGTNHIYATQHSARVVDGKPTLLAGVPITLDQLADIADLAARKTSYRGFIHDRVVYLAPNLLAWWVPACTRRVWFNTKDKIGERAGDATHPPLVFIVNRTTWPGNEALHGSLLQRLGRRRDLRGQCENAGRNQYGKHQALRRRVLSQPLYPFE